MKKTTKKFQDITVAQLAQNAATIMAGLLAHQDYKDNPEQAVDIAMDWALRILVAAREQINA